MGQSEGLALLETQALAGIGVLLGSLQVEISRVFLEIFIFGYSPYKYT